MNAATRAFRLAIALACACWWLPAALAQSTPGVNWAREPAARVEDWQADIDAMVKELPARHKNAFFECPKEKFESAAAELREAVPNLKDYEVVVGLMRLAAMLGDAHTGIAAREMAPSFHQFPIFLYVFSDGPVIIGASAQHADLIGSSLVTFAGVPVDEAFKKVAATSAYENEATFIDKGPRLLVVAEIAQAVGLIPSLDRVMITVRDPQGSERDVELSLLPRGSRIEMRPAKEEELPLYRKKAPHRNWYQVLPESRALYFKYDTCGDEPDQTVAKLSEEILATIDSEHISRVIVDLRGNGGGNSGLLSPFIRGLASRAAIKDSVSVLIGRYTFSSAEMNAAELKKHVGATLIGEPTGQKPNAYGEVKSFVLPRSNITVRYSTKFWKTEEGDRPSLEPDRLVRPSSADFFALRDPVLESALSGSK